MTLPDGLVLIDGHCALCAGSFRFVARRDVACRFRFAPMQTPFGQQAAESLGLDPAAPESFAVIAQGRALLKSDGAIHVLRHLPGWGWTAALLVLPRWLRDWAYDRVARNRYHLFGRREVCLMPDASLRRHMADFAE